MALTPRIEELHTVGEVTIKEFHDDSIDIIAFSDDYGGTFEHDFQAQIDAASDVVTTKFYMNELSALTDKILIDTDLIFPELNLIERYIDLAKANLSKAPKLFGIKAVRDAARSGNAEGLRVAFNTLFQNIEVPADFIAIKAKGLKDTDYAAFKVLAKQLVDENDAQEYYKSIKAKAVLENQKLFDDLLATIKDVQKTGKALYKFTDKAKTDTYTMQVILKRIRHDELHTTLFGTVVLGEIGSAANLKVIARPASEGKRGKTVKTDEKGYFEIRGIKPAIYNIKCTLPDGKLIKGTATAITNKKSEVTWDSE